MYVTKKYHKKIVTTLSALLVLALIFIAIIFFQPDFLKESPLAILTQKYIGTTISKKQLTAQVNPFLHDEEAVIISADLEKNKETILPIEKTLFEYVEVTDGCGPHFEGECLNVRSGPGTNYPVVDQLRNNIVLKVGGSIKHKGETWYKIIFDEWLRYPERVADNWYVLADHVEILLDEGVKTLDDSSITASTTKKIIVDRTKQKLYAYEGETLFMEEKISTGLELSPTPRGEFTIFRKTPSRYMQGPLPNIPGSDYYDLPGVPWNLYFTHQGAVIHGAYWHTSFGTKYSHGCVNLPPDMARKLYNWAEIGTHVVVRD